MCRVARVTVSVREDTALRAEAFFSVSGDPVAWLAVGEREVGLHGSPAALRRFALAAVRAAEHAEELGGGATVLAA